MPMIPYFSKWTVWGTLVATVLAVAGCASVSVDQEGTSIPVPQMPQHIYVAGFGTGTGVWEVDRSGAQLADFQQNLQKMLQTGVVADLSDKLVSASATDESYKSLPPQNAWVITGEFIRVNQGSRFLRMAIGLGAGGTKVETSVHVYDLQHGYRDRPFLNFVTIGGSGAQPGMVESLGLIGAAVKGVAGSARGLTDDTARTGREITAEISEYMFVHRWIPKSEYIRPKILD